MLAIYAPLVTKSAITFEFEPPTVEQFRDRIGSITSRYPWVVADESGSVVGFAYAGPHRSRPAYQWSVETSVYVHSDFRHKGVARLLYECLFELLEEQGFHSAYAGITLPNEASVAFHRALGFDEVGVYREAGFKLGRWHDAVWYQRRIGNQSPDPPAPPRAPEDVMHTVAWTNVSRPKTTDSEPRTDYSKHSPS